MTIQMQTNPKNLCEFAFALQIAETIQPNSRDYGFDFDEDELGKELLAPLPISLAVQSLPEVVTDTFEQTFYYFLS